MTDTKHTPGPWEIVGRHYDRLDIHGAEYNSLQVTVDNAYAIHAAEGGKEDLVIQGMEIAEANARLIAAAPELLNILEYCLQSEESALADGGSILGDDLRASIRAAIAKATGA